MKALPFVIPLALLACLVGGHPSVKVQPEEKAEVRQYIPVDSSREPVFLI